ncbi:hypothetical protein NP233_g10616 [Leucocoprinus birnbaumii]|uniref:G domain-containing protein n=1 Tax=Leucocoprinus birnbaumii TaxID=56174 RepID=A0AAD5YL48_9AGAR|nr:hypothetical protein NP233_g10616 [Leucocoprinus birnbaumii]
MSATEEMMEQDAETFPGTFRCTEEIRPDDIFIALMGPPGEGRKTFISFLCDRTVGQSQFEPMAIYAHDSWKGYEGRRVVLVNFPSFDGRVFRDYETLSLIGTWLKTSNIKLSGFIYLHSLQDTIEADPLLKNLCMLGMICGDVAMKGRVVIIFTPWQDDVAQTPRAIELDILAEQPCQPFIVAGSRAFRLFNKRPQAVREVVGQSINIILGTLDKRKLFLFQEELICLRLNLNETSSAKMLRIINSERLVLVKKKLDVLVARSRSTTGAPHEHEPTKEREELKEETAKLREEIRRLRISNGRRIHLFFQPKRSRAAGVGDFSASSVTLLTKNLDYSPAERRRLEGTGKSWGTGVAETSRERAYRERREGEKREGEKMRERAEREREAREREARERENEERERGERVLTEKSSAGKKSEPEQFMKELMEELWPEHKAQIETQLERVESWLEEKGRQLTEGWEELEENWIKEGAKKAIKEAVQGVLIVGKSIDQ